MVNQVKTPEEITAMRTGGKMLAQVLATLKPQVVPGVTTKQLAESAAAELKTLGGEPAFLGYKGFPDVICISVNAGLVHGIPDDYRVQDGDVVGLDFGVTYNEMICDGAITVVAGEASKEVQKLLSGTQAALAAGIAAVKDGAKVGDISFAIEQRLRQDKLGIVEDLVGHGVGHQLHEEPGIPNYGQAGRGMTLKEGMTIAIEPMATLGGPDVAVGADGWTIYTADGSLSAQFEHTILVTKDGGEILTLN